MQKRAIATKEKILIAATKEFSLKGFHGARMDKIAEIGNVNKQRLYAYYQNKKVLFTEVLRDAYEKINFVEEPLKNLKDKDIPRLAEIILKQYIKFHSEHPEFWRLLAWENLNDGEHLEQLADLRSKSLGHIKHLYEKGQLLGSFNKKVSFNSFMYALTALSYFMYSNRFTMEKLFGMQLNRQEYQENLIAECLKMLQLPLS